MNQFSVFGMSCSACSSRVEKAVLSVKGVSACSVSLLTNSMTVEGDFCVKDVVNAVEKAGYKAVIDQNSENDSGYEARLNQIENNEAPQLLKRLIWSAGFLIILMYLSMGRNMFNFWLPSFLAESPILIGLMQTALALVVIIINRKFFISGTKSVMHGSPNMDTLVAMGSFVSFAYSLSVLVRIFIFSFNQNQPSALLLLHDLYFESSAMILTLITVGKLLEAKAKSKTTSALKGLIELQPKTATVLVDNQEIVVEATSLKVGDIVVVKPGEKIAVDGIIERGTTTVNQSSLTGESMPVDKEAGDEIYSGTMNISGYITIKATKVGRETTLSQIIKLAFEAQSTKAPIAKTADKVSGIFVPTVLLISLITFMVWFFVGKGLGFALSRAISVLVISCPCALGLATPVAIMVGSGVGAKKGVLFKNAISLELAGKAQIIAVDKTGTLTMGEPVVTDLLTFDSQLLPVALSIESRSEHPLSKAIVAYAKSQGVVAMELENFNAILGQGVSGEINGEKVFAGKYELIKNEVEIESDLLVKVSELSNQGKTPMFFVKGNKLLGVIAVADEIKADSFEAVNQLKNLGLSIYMLTGDNEKTARAIGERIGVSQVVANLLPADKEREIRLLQKQGVTIMVGDGINDSPSLIRSDVGIAIGAGTDVAIDSADVVLMKNSLLDVVRTVRLSRATLKIIYQNLFWAFFYNVIAIPLACGAFYPLFGWTLNPMIGALAMSLSSFFVCANALRLNFVNVDSVKGDKKIKQKIVKEKKEMEAIIKIEGMMCPHCSGRVKKVLEGFSQITFAEVSHETGSAKILFSGELDLNLVKKAIESEGYKVIG